MTLNGLTMLNVQMMHLSELTAKIRKKVGSYYQWQ